MRLPRSAREFFIGENDRQAIWVEPKAADKRICAAAFPRRRIAFPLAIPSLNSLFESERVLYAARREAARERSRSNAGSACVRAVTKWLREFPTPREWRRPYRSTNSCPHPGARPPHSPHNSTSWRLRARDCHPLKSHSTFPRC